MFRVLLSVECFFFLFLGEEHTMGEAGTREFERKFVFCIFVCLVS